MNFFESLNTNLIAHIATIDEIYLILIAIFGAPKYPKDAPNTAEKRLNPFDADETNETPKGKFPSIRVLDARKLTIITATLNKIFSKIKELFDCIFKTFCKLIPP